MDDGWGGSSYRQGEGDCIAPAFVQQLLSFASSAEEPIGGDGTSAEEDDCERDGGEREREFVTALAGKTVLQVNLEDGHEHVDADGERGKASEEAEDEQETSTELGEG